MALYFGLRWCPGCAALLIAEAVLREGVCRECANAEYRANYARDGRAIRARVYARKRDVEPLPVVAQQSLMEHFEGLCAYCDNIATTWNHIVPVRDGGRTVAGNVVPACVSCNSSKKCADVLDWCDQTGRYTSRVLDVLLLNEVAV
ncbi:HNH endonuclease signature motif containing protein [Mycolicibacterium elephantis]